MATDIRARALALAAALLAGAAGSAAAQQAPGAHPGHAPRHRGDLVTVGDAAVAADEVIDGRVVVMRGDLRVAGRVTEDVTVAGGNLVLEPGAVVEGDVEVKDGSVRNAGTIRGDAEVWGGSMVSPAGGRVLGETRVSVGSELDAVRGLDDDRTRDTGAAARQHIRHGIFSRLGDGFAGLAQLLGFALLLAGAGAAAVFYALPRLRRMSDAVRQHPLPSGLAGLAAAVLALPVYVVVMVVLAVTLIGLPLLLVVGPLYPLAVVAAGALGLLAVAHAVGEHVAERRGSTDPRQRNAYTYVFTGLALLLAPLAGAHLLQTMAVLGAVGDVLELLAYLLVWGASLLGTGAVLLTRAGGRRAFSRPGIDDVLDDSPWTERPGHA